MIAKGLVASHYVRTYINHKILSHDYKKIRVREEGRYIYALETSPPNIQF